MENLPVHIREVWEDDLEAEFALIRDIVDDFPFITIDTKFPGNVFRPVGNFETCSDYNYQALKANVDMLKLIQLGLTFSDETGNLPTCGTGKPCVWQFNFCEFILGEDLYEIDSIQMLSQSGIDFEMNEKKGVDAHSFAELLMSSGIVLNEDVRLVTFHGGYVFTYLLKLLTGKNQPDTKTGFVKLVKTFFPEFYDIKHMMKFSDGHRGGLNKIAELLGVERIGDHDRRQAGSDSLLTSATFMKRKESFFNGSTEKYEGVLYGLGSEN